MEGYSAWCLTLCTVSYIMYNGSWAIFGMRWLAIISINWCCNVELQVSGRDNYCPGLVSDIVSDVVKVACKTESLPAIICTAAFMRSCRLRLRERERERERERKERKMNRYPVCAGRKGARVQGCKWVTVYW